VSGLLQPTRFSEIPARLAPPASFRKERLDNRLARPVLLAMFLPPSFG
jgi:hypothetical protein